MLAPGLGEGGIVEVSSVSEAGYDLLNHVRGVPKRQSAAHVIHAACPGCQISEGSGLGPCQGSAALRG
jgi:hypothetical protein